jgi:short-subunit dehydrogenase
MKNVSGKTVLLTGASGGLGMFMARAFADAGAKLALVASPGAALDLVREECESRGAAAVSFAADLRDASQRHEAVERVRSQLGSIDVLVNNAGIEFTAPYHELSESDIEQVLAVNLDAPMVLTRLVLPEMLKSGQGHIVNISSLAGKSGPAYEETYAATKAALVAFTTSLRASYRSRGVSASVIVPGFVEAGIYAKLKETSGCSAPAILGTSRPEKVADAVLRAIRQDRLEIIVNPMPVRPILALASLFPSLGEWLIEKMGTNDFFRRVVQATQSRQNDLAPLTDNRSK